MRIQIYAHNSTMLEVRSIRDATYRLQYILPALGLIAVSFALAWLIYSGSYRLALAVTILSTLIGASVVKPQYGIIGTFIFLSFLGDFRRILIPLMGWSTNDPLMLVGPAMVAFFVIGLLASKSIRLDTTLSKLVFALLVIMAIQMVNPLQGGLGVGIAGAMFYIVPLLWFWVGREFSTPDFLKKLLLVVFIPIAIIASALGLYQIFVGWLPYQIEWYNTAGYIALNVRGSLRPISLFPSSTEYLMYVSTAAVVCWAASLRGPRFLLVLIPLFIIAVFFGGTRGPLVSTIFACILLWAIQGQTIRSWVPRLAFAVVIGFIGLVWSLTQLQSTEFVGAASGLAQHQTQGLLNIGDEDESTARAHADMFLGGIKRGFANPVGSGLGSTTMAAARFGAGGGSTEVDLSNMFVSLGFIGGIVYVLVMFLAAKATVLYWDRSRTLLALAVIGILVSIAGQWLTGSHYAISALVWLCIGSIDRFQRDELY